MRTLAHSDVVLQSLYGVQILRDLDDGINNGP